MAEKWRAEKYETGRSRSVWCSYFSAPHFSAIKFGQSKAGVSVFANPKIQSEQGINLRSFSMRLISIAFTICITASVPGSVSAQLTPKRSAELQVLDRFIGDWESVVTVKGTDEKSRSVQSRKWSREGKFVLSEEMDLSSKTEAHFLITYDSKGKQYRACFINGEATVPILGTWDEKLQTMKWKSPDIAFKHDGIHRFIDNDHVEWTMNVTSPDGQVVLELSAKQTRRKR